MKTLQSPCHGCAERKFACHDTCPKYGMFREAIRLEKEAEKRVKTLEDYGHSLIVKKPRR